MVLIAIGYDFKNMNLYEISSLLSGEFSFSFLLKIENIFIVEIIDKKKKPIKKVSAK
jgi:hypothetical protein